MSKKEYMFIGKDSLLSMIEKGRAESILSSIRNKRFNREAVIYLLSGGNLQNVLEQQTLMCEVMKSYRLTDIFSSIQECFLSDLYKKNLRWRDLGGSHSITFLDTFFDTVDECEEFLELLRAEHSEDSPLVSGSSLYSMVIKVFMGKSLSSRLDSSLLHKWEACYPVILKHFSMSLFERRFSFSNYVKKLFSSTAFLTRDVCEAIVINVENFAKKEKEFPLAPASIKSEIISFASLLLEDFFKKASTENDDSQDYSREGINLVLDIIESTEDFSTLWIAVKFIQRNGLLQRILTETPSLIGSIDFIKRFYDATIGKVLKEEDLDSFTEPEIIATIMFFEGDSGLRLKVLSNFLSWEGYVKKNRTLTIIGKMLSAGIPLDITPEMEKLSLLKAERWNQVFLRNKLDKETFKTYQNIYFGNDSRLLLEVGKYFSDNPSKIGLLDWTDEDIDELEIEIYWKNIRSYFSNNIIPFDFLKAHFDKIDIREFQSNLDFSLDLTAEQVKEACELSSKQYSHCHVNPFLSNIMSSVEARLCKEGGDKGFDLELLHFLACAGEVHYCTNYIATNRRMFAPDETARNEQWSLEAFLKMF